MVPSALAASHTVQTAHRRRKNSMPSASDGCVASGVASSRTGRLSHWHSRITRSCRKTIHARPWQIMHSTQGHSKSPYINMQLITYSLLPFYLHNTSPIRLCHNRGNGGRRGNTDVLAGHRHTPPSNSQSPTIKQARQGSPFSIQMRSAGNFGEIFL